MAKLKLNPDEIRVNGFEVVSDAGAEAIAITAVTNCQQDTCWNGRGGPGYPGRPGP